MNCVICGQNQAVIKFQRDDPILGCGHLQASDEETLLIEQTIYQTKELVKQKQSEGMTEGEAENSVILDGLKKMSHKWQIYTLRFFNDSNLHCEIIDKFISRLSKLSQRFIRRE